jgi:hypothetical protein
MFKFEMFSTASAADFRFLCKKTVFYKYETDIKIKYKTRHIIIPGLGVHVIARVTVRVLGQPVQKKRCQARTAGESSQDKLV